MAASLLSLAVIALLSAAAAATNITEILSAFPEYSEFNALLTKTKLADEINSREPVTVCALPNGALSAVTGKYPLAVVKNVLALHVLLDYFDGPKLHKISDGSVLSTTLYQTTGNAAAQLGFVNITDVKGGKVAFGSGVPGSPLDSTFTKSVKQFPYNLSVIELSKAIAPSAVLAAPAPSANLTALLDKAGCKTFASLIVSTGVAKVFASAADKGLTIFAPNDEAFKAADAPDLSKLTNAEVVSLLQYHALAAYSPVGSLKQAKGRIATLATNGAGKYDLGVKTAGDSVTLDTGVDSSRIASTVLDATPLCIFTVDSLLLPVELFGKAPSPAPGPAPETSPSPSPAEAPTPASSPEPAAAPSPFKSPPAPPTNSPDGAPSEGPTADSQSSTTDNSGSSLVAPAAAWVKMLLAVATVLMLMS
ncbi:fasciclin-like arabinogalactan protein 10 [Salvia miltiorrhiza]|uniref:fasciclin-like arabinogalactan protein 10 n=1 Tax=Salvia miltiorrhiza TaxID=226208 RepID=UPI0025ABCF16|nr:fasciclin-like arabinogalactan protein 10 [Salvia miltiorrhiza]